MIKYKRLELSYEELFGIDNDKKLGVMRIDCYDGNLANIWNPTELLIKLNNENKIVKLCNGTGYESETLLFDQAKYNNYVIKLIPVRDSYSYIFTYNK